MATTDAVKRDQYLRDRTLDITKRADRLPRLAIMQTECEINGKSAKKIMIALALRDLASASGRR